ncbi:MAG: hypothetical protein K5879_05650 [Lachnospiraceae bacterium]|nr:hypothetical protein [Lachnospiraceae bacterium]
MIKSIIVALILCVIEILVIVIASPMAKSSLVLRFLPEDVRLAAKDYADPPKHKQVIAHMLLGFFLTAMFAGMIFIGVDSVRNNIGYWQLTLRFIVMLYVMKVFDIVVQDQWLVMTVGYFKKIYPETADCEGWKNRGFNNKNQIIRIIAYPFLCLIIAAVFILIKSFIMK